MLSERIKKALALLKLEKVEGGDYGKTGYHVEAAADPGQMPEVAKAMLAEGCFLESLTAVDYPAHFTLVYHFASYEELCRTVVHAKLDKRLMATSITAVYPAANWYERSLRSIRRPTGMSGKYMTSSASSLRVTRTCDGFFCLWRRIFTR